MPFKVWQNIQGGILKTEREHEVVEIPKPDLSLNNFRQPESQVLTVLPDPCFSDTDARVSCPQFPLECQRNHALIRLGRRTSENIFPGYFDFHDPPLTRDFGSVSSEMVQTSYRKRPRQKPYTAPHVILGNLPADGYRKVVQQNL